MGNRLPKVLCVESGASGGGSAASLLAHVRALGGAGFEFHAVFATKSAHSARLEKEGIRTHYLPASVYSQGYANVHPIKRKFLNAVVKVSAAVPFFPVCDQWLFRSLYQSITEIIVKENIQLVHTNNQPNRDYYAILAAGDKAVPIVAHVRSHLTNYFTRRKASYCNKHVSKYICYSSNTQEAWIRMGVAAEKTVVILNAASELSAVDNDEAPSKYRDTNVKLLVILGLIRPERGYEFFFRVLQVFRTRYQIPIRLVVAGSDATFPDYAKDLADLRAALGLQDVVDFVGQVDDPHSLIKNSDLVVLPYSTEVFGRALIEAWQLRVPVAMSRVGGIEGIASDGKDCLLFDYGNLDACVDAILRLLVDQQLRERVVENGLKKVERICSAKQYADEVARVYREALQLTCPGILGPS